MEKRCLTALEAWSDPKYAQQQYQVYSKLRYNFHDIFPNKLYIKSPDICKNIWLSQTGDGHHLREQFGDNAASFPHLALLAVGQIRNDSDNLTGRCSLECVRHDQHLHHVIVHTSDTNQINYQQPTQESQTAL